MEGLQAVLFARQSAEQIEPRLRARLLAGLQEDVAALERAGDEGKAKTAELKGLTDTKPVAAEKASHWAAAMPEALKQNKAALVPTTGGNGGQAEQPTPTRQHAGTGK